MAEFHQIAGYDVVATLGQGAASTLYAVRDKKGEMFCLKRVVKNSPSEQRFLDQAICEYEVAQKVDSPLLRKVHRLIKHRALIRTNEVLVLLEMVEGKTIEHVKLASILSFCKLFHAAATGIKMMHEAGYVHADIKPSNIMITNEGKVKIIDFGQSCKVNTVKQRIQGTPDYIAPEQVLRRPITFRTDSFNLGATMYWKLTGRHVPTLIPKKDTAISLRAEGHGEFVPPIEVNDEVPPALSNLVMECVQTEPKQRPANMDAIIDRLGIAASQAQRAAAVGTPGSDAASEQRNAS
ncbi:MAG: serine/threonine-protein kinase [Phycisphaerales bacterium JB063]